MRRRDNDAGPGVWAGLTLDRPHLMGILNVTPDSFSDGGRHPDAGAAIGTGLAMAREGAAIIDVGGESTRPGATPVTVAEEQSRVIPVIRGLVAQGVTISVDTRHAATMEAALDAGATIVNDVSGLNHDSAARALIAKRGCSVVLMHMRGTPDVMARQAVYDDVAAEVARELSATATAAVSAGIRPESIAIDPGIGFAKTTTQSVAVLRNLSALTALGFPILVGVSRKSFIGAIVGESDATRRLGGSLAAGLFALSRGAAILRVHDVRETAQALHLWETLTA